MGSIANPSTWARDNEPSHPIQKVDYPKASSAPVPTEGTEIRQILSNLLHNFNDILFRKEFVKLPEVLNTESCYWKDHIGITETKFTTLTGAARITEFIHENGCLIKSIAADKDPKSTSFDPADTVKCLQSFITFDSEIGTGRGLVNIIRDVDDGDRWKIYTLFTFLYDLHGVSERDVLGENRAQYSRPDNFSKEKNWKDYVEEKKRFVDDEPTVLVVGAGHCGLMAAARLEMLGVKCLIIDLQKRGGDMWRNRYHNLCLHDPCWMNKMPYFPYPANWPLFASKDQIAGFMEYYVTALDLNLWNQTSIISSTWNAETAHWTVVLENRSTGSPVRTTHHPRHIVQATGLNGPPRIPSFQGASDFQGKIHHSSAFSGATPQYAGRKVIVVGAGNSGHDIAYHAHLHGARVTMVQRSETYVVGHSTMINAFKSRYNEQTHTEDADLISAAMPISLTSRIGHDVSLMLYRHDLPLLESLQKAGFKTVTPPDLPSILILAQTRAGGFYVDIGCSPLIASGAIKVHQGRNISHLSATSMVFDDGSEVEADEIILATGYVGVKVRTRETFGDKVADSIETIWGIDEEGEQRGVYKRYCSNFSFLFSDCLDRPSKLLGRSW
ncbi:hypothetical protein BP5796_08966 [Coleophoma crateriformis]|uniref:FAD/NAD(P)-binding domain-containing protein n=1 Tax=Coleophoma crateriformis TaxID=565419 RepID=A0A3D8R2P3_9HELO|nr:hypothetical protein BP5796_08966 [Coleophoma crateriformis]